MVELFGRLQGKPLSDTAVASSLPILSSDGEVKPDLTTLLTVLAVFLGESEENSKPPSDLAVEAAARDEIVQIFEDAEAGRRREARVGLPDDPKFWTLSTEWVEPVSEWIHNPDLLLPQLAAKYDIFEGNLQRALMKLMGLVEEFRALCELTGEVEWLKELEGAQELVLRGVVVAESLYLRL